MNTRNLLLSASLCFLFSHTLFSKERVIDGIKYSDEKLFEGSEVIWGFDFISPDELLFSERSGKLKLLNLKTLKSHEVSGVPKVYSEDQGGLLDVLYDQKDKKVYLTYSDPEAEKPTTSLWQGAFSADKKNLIGKRLFQTKAFEKGGIHFGSRVLIDKHENIFLSVGDRSKRDRAQQLDNHQGKILRITKEGKPAEGNPFIGVKDALPEIWSYGHRNPQGMALDNQGQLFNAEMGPRGGDEINLIEKGANYGWPVITYGREYYGPKIGTTEKPGLKQPVFYWVPSINPSGIAFYSGKSFSAFENNLFMAGLGGSLHRLQLKNNKMIKEDKLLEDLAERFRQVKVGPDSFIYTTTDSGKIIRLSPIVK